VNDKWVTVTFCALNNWQTCQCGLSNKSNSISTVLYTWWLKKVGPVHLENASKRQNLSYYDCKNCSCVCAYRCAQISSSYTTAVLVFTSVLHLFHNHLCFVLSLGHSTVKNLLSLFLIFNQLPWKTPKWSITCREPLNQISSLILHTHSSKHCKWFIPYRLCMTLAHFRNI